MESRQPLREIPIREFRAHTAEILRSVNETMARYVVTNHGKPVADVVPHGSQAGVGESLLGAWSDAYDRGWENVPLQERLEMERRMWNMTDEEYDAAMNEMYAKYNSQAG